MAGNYYGTFGTGATARDTVKIYVTTFDTLGYRINADSVIVKRFWGGATNPVVDSFIWTGAGTRTGFYDTSVAAEAGTGTDSLGEWGLEIYWKVQGKSFNKEGFYIVVSGLPTGTGDPQDIRNLDTVNVLSTDTVNLLSTDTIKLVTDNMAEIANLDGWNPITDNESLIVDQSTLEDLALASRSVIGDTNNVVWSIAQRDRVLDSLQAVLDTLQNEFPELAARQKIGDTSNIVWSVAQRTQVFDSLQAVLDTLQAEFPELFTVNIQDASLRNKKGSLGEALDILKQRSVWHSENKILNPDFEMDSVITDVAPTHWTASVGTKFGTAITDVTSGKYSAYITGNLSGDTSAAIKSNQFSVPANMWIHYGGYFNKGSADVNQHASFRLYKASSIVDSFTIVSTGAGINPKQSFFVTSDTGTYRVEFFTKKLTAGVGQIFVDNAFAYVFTDTLNQSFAASVSNADAAKIADSVWQDVKSQHTTDGTYGKYLDTTVSSRATSGVGVSAGEMAAIADTVWKKRQNTTSYVDTMFGNIIRDLSDTNQASLDTLQNQDNQFVLLRDSLQAVLDSIQNQDNQFVLLMDSIQAILDSIQAQTGGWGGSGSSDTANMRLAGFMRRYTFGGGSDTSYTKNPAAGMTGSAIDTLLVRDSCNNVNLAGVRVEISNKSGQLLAQFTTPTSGRIILQGNANDTVIVTERATTYTFSIPDTVVINGGDIDTVFGCLFTPNSPPQSSMVTLWGCLQDFSANYGTGAEVNISLERLAGRILWKIGGSDTTLADYTTIKVNVNSSGTWQQPVFWSALYKYYDNNTAAWVAANPKYIIEIINNQGIPLTGRDGLRVTANSVTSQRVYSGQ